MKLKLDKKGENLWCVHDEMDDHIGGLRGNVTTGKFMYVSEPNNKVEFHAVDENAALTHVQKLYDDGELKPEEKEKPERIVDGAVVDSYIESQVGSLFTLAEYTDSNGRLLDSIVAYMAKLAFGMSADGRREFKEKLIASINESIDRFEEEKKMRQDLGKTIGGLLNQLFSSRLDDDDGDEDQEQQQPARPTAH